VESRQPNLYVVAGPNGAGKSTFARRRFARGLRNLFQIYAPVFDAWLILDNSMKPPEPVAFTVADQRFILEKELFAGIERDAGKQ
jgi:predicted ABC-type ATPase